MPDSKPDTSAPAEKVEAEAAETVPAPPAPIATVPAIDRELEIFKMRLACLQLASTVGAAAMGGTGRLRLAENYFDWIMGTRDPEAPLATEDSVKTYADLQKEGQPIR